MGEFKRFVRKLIPLRACVFERWRKDFDRELDSVRGGAELVNGNIVSLREEVVSLERKAASSDDVQSLRAEIEKCSESQRQLTELLKLIIERLDASDDLARSRQRDLNALRKKLEDCSSQWVSYSRGYDFERTRLPEELDSELRRWYKDKTGKALDLSAPITFNEKMQWLKLNDRDRDGKKALLSDKLRNRHEVEQVVGADHMVRLLGSWGSFDEIDLSTLPDEFVLKCNHGSGWNRIVRKEGGSCPGIAALRDDFKKWLSTDYSYKWGFELHYGLIEPAIIAEEYLDHSESFVEVQIWCFNGHPEFASVIKDPHGGNEKVTYSIEWEKLPFVTSMPRMASATRPECFDVLVKCAEELSKDFIFARVDYYVLDGRDWRFSEITFTPASGLCMWDPPEYDFVLGEKLVLPFENDE